ncbi:antitoxin [Streptomyces sp. TLI_146]|uniref:antitoxin n=1 Tax=Streptomyces sp. TLI_146 TaxID=1938858 RepID=UPI000C710208|nr:antitoxin [Streptomyces sp. TLI_146]PKV86165.1 antitoxin protein of toxin-antitoxin system [Streptomyces sp. TLI_146]
MGILDRFKDQAHNKADDLVESAGDEVDERTGGRFADQVDQAQDKAKDKAREALGIDASAQEPAGQRPVEQQASEQQTSEQPSEQPEQQQPPA